MSLQTAAQNRISEQRKKLGLAEDSASDKIWNQRISSGKYTEDDAFKAMQNKLKDQNLGINYSYKNHQPSFTQPMEPGSQVVGKVGDSPTSDNFGETPSTPTPTPAQSTGLPSNLWQGGSQAGDANYTTPEQITTRAAQIRANRGLPPDPASDAIWAQRVSSGQATMADARDAITGKAAKQTDALPVGENAPEPSDTTFAFDPQYSEGMNQIEQQRAALRSEEELQRRRNAEDADEQRRQAGDWRDDSLTANTERMADNGMVHSGINVKAQSDIGEDYVEYNNQIAKAQARGEEDLVRMLTGQRDKLQNMERQLEFERGERQAALEREKAMNDAINATPKPTAAGRYDLGHIGISQDAVQNAGQGTFKGDMNYIDDPNSLGKRIEDIFTNRNVAIHTEDETDAQRIARLVEEVGRGRTLDDVRASVDRIARQSNI